MKIIDFLKHQKGNLYKMFDNFILNKLDDYLDRESLDLHILHSIFLYSI
jgi:hypothetical protein